MYAILKNGETANQNKRGLSAGGGTYRWQRELNLKKTFLSHSRFERGAGSQMRDKKRSRTLLSPLIDKTYVKNGNPTATRAKNREMDPKRSEEPA